MLQLLSLLQDHSHRSATDLAERLGVTTRTIRRDVDRLRQLGYPVAGSAGVTGGYRLEAGTQVPPLLLDDDEAVAIAIGLRSAASATVTGIEEASVRALTKLDQVLPGRLRRRVNALHAYTVPLATPTPTVDAELLAQIALCCRDAEQLRFRYSAADGATTRRTTEPHRLVSAGRRWYLVAWDTLRSDWRTFRVDRIDQAAAIGVRFRPRELPGSIDAATFVAESMHAAFAVHEAVVRLHAPVESLRARVPPSAGTLEPDGDDACLLRATTESLEWLAAYIGVLGVEFEVVDSPALLECVQAVGQRFARAAAGGATTV
jgi:predicted DNA-binding transcriptional regulator YafY